MVGGFDRYFQFARCFRDEDLRADRQPEFTQIDVEMSFVTMQDVMDLGERVCKNMWAAAGYEIPSQSFRHMTYTEAMTSYGCDKPDLRFDMRLTNLDAPFINSSADFLNIAANEKSKSVVGFNLGKWSKSMSRKDVDALVKQVRASGCQTATFIQVSANDSEWTWKSSIAKFLTNDNKEQLKRTLSLQEGDMVIVGLGATNKTLEAMGKVRLQCATELERKGLPVRPLKGSANEFEFLWVTDFPLFTPEEEPEQSSTPSESDSNHSATMRLGTTHHPFTAPHADDMKYLNGTVEGMMKIRGQHFDLVVNGVELGGGSIRIHSSDVQRKVLQDCLKVDAENFEHLLTALESGCPPHGGFALGFDRAMALLTHAESLRDVIAFPKSFSGKEPMTSSPAPLSQEDLDVYNLQFRPAVNGV
ncbi:hypothetical protein SARC_04255 [Sphaeroforma arctica JP610]|uniref:Aminoacyl-transfer RNA synthetases class-II family profile domain-containing protein n=1 Tax=Sphaeroforma arctica JP610 TaxID=667725 RepID=A0A0L0G3R6_9EUKA|nr:hypothetical protein SARC_04255 [Sphaeroforma arctica JP610]KNC83499.1 hypothetical protein SARC_04255 [Sphaeroforma arctica JP610]|eukprot:XP_014157401.1 hypothetical protein SARC_04255 [Sphaeroforma arctica JP610]